MNDGKPLCIDLYCGLGGWSEAFIAEGYDCVGYDIEAHDYGTGGYPGTLILRDVRSIHGSELKDATCIVGSSPCQEFSYRAMPWKRAKALPPPYLGIELFNAQFRIQREASEAAGRHIPMVVENVRGAQKWVGHAAWHYGSFYLWGDVPALMLLTFRAVTKTSGLVNIRDGHGHTRHLTNQSERDAVKVTGPERVLAGEFAWNKREAWQDARREAVGTKPVASLFGANCQSSMSRMYGSKSIKRKAASAMIAKIPFPLAQWIARVYKPVTP